MHGGKHSAYLAMVFAALVACDDSQQSKSLQVLRQLHAIAGQANQAAPAAIDENTRLDGAQAGPGLRLTTTYTLVHSPADGMDSTKFATQLTPVIKDGSCKNPDLRPLIDQGAVVVLDYRASDGKPVGTVSVDRDTCAAIH